MKDYNDKVNLWLLSSLYHLTSEPYVSEAIESIFIVNYLVWTQIMFF